MAAPRVILPPLHRAVKEGNCSKVRARLGAGDDVNEYVEYLQNAFCTALFIAVGNQDRSMMKLLLEKGANPSSTSEPDGKSVLFLAVTMPDLEVPRMLIEAGSKINLVDKTGNSSALHMAATMRDARMVKLLISAEAVVDIADHEGMTPLLICARHGSEDCVRLLINAGADLSRTNSKGLTALHFASQGTRSSSEEMKDLYRSVTRGEDPSSNERANVIGLLLGAGMDADVCTNQHGITPLMLGSDLAVVRALLESGASVTALDRNDNTVMHHAAIRGCNAPIICSLFKSGANPSLLNTWGRTPADVARAQGHRDTAQLLEMLAIKYREKEAFEANEQRAAATPSAGVAELDDKMKAVVLDSESGEASSSKISAEAEAGQFSEQRSADMLCKGEPDVEVVGKMKEAIVSSSSGSGEGSKIPVEAEAEKFDTEVEDVSQFTQVTKEVKEHKVLQPCLHCQSLTHRRCARCKTTFFCSRDCQMATMAEHKPICLQKYEERERTKAKRKAKEEEA